MQINILCKDISHIFDDDDTNTHVNFSPFVGNKNFVIMTINNIKIVINKNDLKEVVEKV